MTEPAPVLQRPDSRSSSSWGLSGSSGGLPADLVEKASRRLGIAALVYAGGYVAAYGSGSMALAATNGFVNNVYSVGAWSGNVGAGQTGFSRTRLCGPTRSLSASTS